MNNIEILKKFINLNSKSSNISGVNRFGKTIMNMYKDLEIEWEIIKKEGAGDFLIGRTERIEDKPVICLSAHLDVVFEPTKVKFGETVDKLYGSGVSDMKSSFLIIYNLLKKLKEDGKLNNIILAFSPEEETATLNHRDSIEKAAKESDYVLVFESTLNNDLDAPLDRRSVVVSRRGFQHFEVTLEGPGGHSGLLVTKEERLNTILYATEIIQKLNNLSDYKNLTTVNIGEIRGGQAVNVIAPKTEFVFEFRFKFNSEYERMHSEIKKIFNKENFPKAIVVNLKENKFYPNLENDSQEFVEICKEIAKEQNLKLDIEERNAGSEACLYKFYNPKAQVLDGFGMRGKDEHTMQEFVFKDSLESTTKYCEAVVKKILA